MRARIDKIAECDFNYVGVSLDGIRETHDKFRRMDGAFEASLKGIRLCRDLGLKIGVRFTMTQDNAHDLPELLKLVEDEGIDRFYFSHLNYAGRGNKNRGTDAVWQTIPTAWIKAAQARWKPRESKGDMTGMGFDPARGGQDKSTLARAHTENWIDELLQVPGVVTDDGPKAAAWVVQHVRNGAPVAVDSIGIGSSALDFCVQLGLNMHPVVGSEAANGRDKAGQLYFRNVRAMMYWRLREALDPKLGDNIALPPDSELLADLSAPRWSNTAGGVLIEDKEEIKKRIGRSTDCGDAVAMAMLPVVTISGWRMETF